MFIYNYPIPLIANGDPEKHLPHFINGIKKLESIGVDFIVMPCNSAHYFYESMKKEVSIPFFNIMEETLKKIKLRGYKKVGLLATETTVKYKPYDNILEYDGIKVIIPENQEKVNEIVLNILAGKKLEEDKNELIQITKEMIKKVQKQ